MKILTHQHPACIVRRDDVIRLGAAADAALETMERVRDQVQVTELQTRRAPGRDPIDSYGVQRARERIRELDEWISGVSPAGSPAVLEAYELERRQLREWLALGKQPAPAVFTQIEPD